MKPQKIDFFEKKSWKAFHNHDMHLIQKINKLQVMTEGMF